MSELDTLNNFKIVNSQLDASLAKKLGMGFGLFSAVSDSDINKKAFIVDAILYKELPEQLTTEPDGRVNRVKAIGISINLLYTSLSLSSNITIPQLAASLRYGNSETSMRIEGIGIGVDGVREILRAQVSVNSNTDVKVIDDLHNVLENIYVNLVTYIDTHNNLVPQDFRFYRKPDEMDNFKKTQSIIYGMKAIKNGERLESVNIPTPYIKELIEFSYGVVLGNDRLYREPEPQDRLKAQNFLNQ